MSRITKPEDKSNVKDSARVRVSREVYELVKAYADQHQITVAQAVDFGLKQWLSSFSASARDLSYLGRSIAEQLSYMQMIARRIGEVELSSTEEPQDIEEAQAVNEEEESQVGLEALFGKL